MSNFIDKSLSLTPAARRVVCEKATEAPHMGIYNHLASHGTYLCRRCGLGLFRAFCQFAGGCGWPSFDDDIPGAVQQLPDLDGCRVELCCSRCGGHLGHIFKGEFLTDKNRRYCVNSLAIDFVSDSEVRDTQEAILAAGCFWGVEYYLCRIYGVLNVEVGFTGGVVNDPTYAQIGQGNTGHYEAVRVLYDVDKTDYYTVLKRFFEIHDPTQRTGQGPDLGKQYQSAVFYYDRDQQTEAVDIILQLKAKGYDVATCILKAQTFWPAELIHQNYYAKQKNTPYCHIPVARFD